jgi:repressor LexA
MTRMTARALEANAQRGRRHRRMIVDYISSYQAEHGWAPTVREIGDAIGLASPSSAHAHLVQLRNEGRLVLGGGPRMIRLTDPLERYHLNGRG